MPTLTLSLNSFAAEGPVDWPASLLNQAMAADQVGVDRVVVSDHVVFGERLEEYARPEIGGREGGRQPTGPDGLWLEPFTVLAAVSSVTHRVRLGTGILLAALRRPVVLAKQLSSLDVLSGGRLDIGVGVGWQREEYEAAGLDFDRRGRLLDHSLEVCQALWSERRSSYDAPELRFQDIHQMPKPLQPGGVSLWVSGTANQAVFRRLARFGRAWIPWGPAAADPGPAILEMRAALAEVGHPDPSGVGVAVPLPVQRDDSGRVDPVPSMAAVPALAAAGVTDFRVGMGLPEDFEEMVDLYGRLVDAFHRSVD